MRHSVIASCVLVFGILAGAAASADPPHRAPVSAPAVPSVQGSTYVGPASHARSQPGCEGCGERGEVTFRADASVQLIDPGSDIIESGRYVQRGAEITVTPTSGTPRTYDLLDHGRTLIDRRYGTRFTLQTTRSP